MTADPDDRGQPAGVPTPPSSPPAGGAQAPAAPPPAWTPPPPPAAWSGPPGGTPPPPPGWTPGPAPWGQAPAPSRWPGAPAPAASRRRAWIVAAAVAAGLLVGVAVAVPVAIATRGGSGGGSGTSSSAASLYSQAIAAMRSSSGFHYVATTGATTDFQRIVGDAGRDSGTQVITLQSSYGTEQFTLVLSGGVVYFEGNAPALRDQVGVPASGVQALVGRWISVSSHDGPYSVLQPGITVSSQVQEVSLQPRSSSPASSGGVAITRIFGTVAQTQGSPAGTGHIDVANGTHLPVSYVENSSVQGVGITSTTTFSSWGSTPHITVPTSAVAWSSLGASAPPGGYGSGGTGQQSPGSGV